MITTLIQRDIIRVRQIKPEVGWEKGQCQEEWTCDFWGLFLHMWKDCRKEHRKTRKFETYANIEESYEDGYERGKDEAYAYYDENEGEEEDDDNDDVESDIDEQDEF